MFPPVQKYFQIVLSLNLSPYFAHLYDNFRAVGTWWHGMAAAIPIFEKFIIVCHNLPYQYFRDLLSLPHQYFRVSNGPVISKLCLSVCLFVRLFVHLNICPSVRPPKNITYLFVCWSVCLLSMSGSRRHPYQRVSLDFEISILQTILKNFTE